MFRKHNLTLALLVGAALALARGAGGSPPPASGEEKLWVALRDKAMARGPLVRLGDIAAINGGTASQRERLAKLDLMELSSNQATQLIPKEVVYYRLLLSGLGADDFHLLGADQSRVTFVKDAVASSLKASAGETAALAKDDEPAAVKSRDPIRLLARLGGLRITTMGEALQDGRMGQNIRVRNVDSNKVVTGRVVDRGVVEVDY